MNNWITGMDLSTLLAVEENGGKFYDNGSQADAMEILQGYGMNLVRLRLWNDPFDENGNAYGAGGGDIETTLALAKRAKKLGVGWLLDFHYSDFWADPGKQRVPKAWRGMNEKELEQAVYEYTSQILNRCREEDIVPQMVAVGNELSNGLLWPLGQLPPCRKQEELLQTDQALEHAYQNVAAFVSAGIRAVRDFEDSQSSRNNPDNRNEAAAGMTGEKEAQSIARDAENRADRATEAAVNKIPVMLHLDNGGNNALYRSWFDHYFANGGEDFEYIGLSYYPFWHGTLDMLQNNMNDIAKRYGKKLIVAEVSMGFTMEDYAAYEHLASGERKGMATKPEIAANVPYPMTPQGQADFMRDCIRVIRQVPDGLGCGFIYWEPAWIPVPNVGWANAASCAYIQEPGPYGNEWANQALFDYEGNALPTLQVIGEEN
ncbi:MAG: glycosyl hydrolase 53 family protein [Clostridiales bacterium]|nr:glycosyl hydrolase 53 family protein [Clostridiales bacterium]